MSNTVNDILGVGFKYEQTAEEQFVPPAVGTKTAIVGTSHWGPIGVNRYITGGLQEFKNIYGFAGTSADEGVEAASYHFRWSSLGYFTRIASSANKPKRSYKLVTTAPTKASKTGNVDISNGAVITSADDILAFDLTHQAIGQGSPETLSISVDFGNEGVLALPAELLSTIEVPAGSLTNADSISFRVFEDGVGGSLFTYTGPTGPTPPETIANIGSLVTLLDGALVTAQPTTPLRVTASGNFLKISSDRPSQGLFGSGIEVRVTAATGYFAALFPAFPASARRDFGFTPSVDSIIDTINNVIGETASPANDNRTLADIYGPNFSAVSVNNSGFLIIQSPSAGASSNIDITTANTTLGISTTGEVPGTDGRNIGTFRAAYRGKEGDTIEIEVLNSASANPLLNVYFRGTLAGSVANYNFDINSTNYLGKILRENSVLSQIVAYDHGRFIEVFDESDNSLDVGEAIPGVTANDKVGDGFWLLSGGDSGESNINIGKDIIPVVRSYSSVDLYDVDIISVPGYSQQSIQDALIDDVAVVRQDTWAVLDMPEITGTNAVDNAIRWTNGEYTGRNQKLDSIYASVYFPYIKIRKATYDSSLEVSRVLGDYSPTTRVLGMIARNDFLATTKFAAPAGEIRGVLQDVEGVQVNLTQTDRDRLYGDVFDGIINPINFNIQSGFFVGGQKTALRKNANGRLTALSRVNVMRTGLYIKKEIAKQTKFFFFEPNDPKSWSDFRSLIVGIMNFLVERRAIEDNYIVKCDPSTNTPDITNNNGMIATIEWTPTKSIERIKAISSIRERTATLAIAA